MVWKKILVLGAVVAVILVCGCEERTSNKELPNKISFDGGGIFKLINGSLTLVRDNDSGEVIEARLVMQFQNIADRYVNANVSVVLYDENNIELYKENKEFSFPARWKDTSITPANIVSYTGDNAAKVDHATITVREIT